ncbi:MAG: hypothetical protein GAK39_02717 [Variovorax sp.]|nr:MAG: hypothetical protein GAK39_02717 [Variovorax sp.]
MTSKQVPGPSPAAPVDPKEASGKTPGPPTPKEVTDTVESQHAAKPGQGPKNKGSIDRP